MLKKKFGYTIVELLVVIVVIGVLASIVVLSYVGISKKAIEAGLQADLANAKKQIALYYSEYDSYPTSINNTTNCPTSPIEDNKYCLKPSLGNDFYYSGGPSSYNLVASCGGVRYKVTNDSSPTVLSFPTGIALDSWSWDQIGLVSELGLAQDYFSVGDTKTITLTTNEVIILQIYGFNHDDKADGTGKTNITFGLKELMLASRQYNSAISTNEGGWGASNIRSWVGGALYNSLPSDLKSIIRTVNKKTSIGSVPINTPSSTMVNSTDKLFLFSEVEIMDSRNMASYGEGSKYPIFTDTASRVKHYKNGPDVQWWTRSPTAGLNTSSIVATQLGSSGTTGVQSTAYINFGFAIGNSSS